MIKQKNNSFPHYFIVFFVILIILDSIFVYLATSTHRGVVTDNAYNQGLNYNKIIEASKKQNDLNWKSEIIYQDDFLNFYAYDLYEVPQEDFLALFHAQHDLNLFYSLELLKYFVQL